MRIITYFLSLGLLFSIQAQIPNSSFENWAGNSEPVGWGSNNANPMFVFVISPTSNAHSGTLAARGEMIANPNGDPYPPLMSCDVPVLQEPIELTGWYEFAPTVNTVSLEVTVNGFDADQFLNGSFGTTIITTAQSGYSMFSVAISAPSGEPTASIAISISLYDSDVASIGSTFHVDDLALDFATSVTDLDRSKSEPLLDSPYPSPFNGSTRATLQLKNTDRVHAEVYDALGQTIDVLFSGNLSAGKYDLTWEPNIATQAGLYFIRVRTSAGTITRRVVLEQ